MNKPEIMSTVEWQARCDLAALYRLIAHFRMTDLIEGFGEQWNQKPT